MNVTICYKRIFFNITDQMSCGNDGKGIPRHFSTGHGYFLPFSFSTTTSPLFIRSAITGFFRSLSVTETVYPGSNLTVWPLSSLRNMGRLVLFRIALIAKTETATDRKIMSNNSLFIERSFSIDICRAAPL